MIREVVMPKLGQTMEEASIEAWRVKEGDTVQKGDILLEINTDKAALEVESFYAGVVKKLLYAKGDAVPCNAVIAFLGDAADAVTDEMVQRALAAAKAAAAARGATAPKAAEPGAAVASAAEAPSVADAPPVAAEAPGAPAGRILASPRARRTASERRIPLQVLRGSGPEGRIVEADVIGYAKRIEGLRVSPTALEVAWQRGVDLTKVKPSGVDGRIMRADVEAAAPAAARGPRGRRVPLTAMRRVVAQRMALSKATIPHFYLTMDVDMTGAVELRRELAASSGRKVSFNDLFIRAASLAFAEVPEMNCAWAEGAVVYRDEVNIGLAVGIEGGLIVPVVRNCEGKSLLDVSGDTEALIAKARSKRLTPDDYEGGCLTISNLGMFGVDAVLPIINPGEVAILGVGRIAKRPVAVGDGIGIRQMTTLVLACDHRLVDGVIGAKFFQKIKELLEAPKSLA
ncbi:MAG TPA: dihydrolipoamide acetyltransferase family protein [Planctomycetota bacterium]|nr:dihydrolipoamide acetyltransferase family protein [Planctomycetota bacterium]